MLVIDEVHNVAPSGRGRYATDSQRTKTVLELAPHFEHHLYLSATPHNGYREAWTALLAMLDPQRFARGITPSEVSLRRAMVRRLKSELRADPALANPDGTPRFAVREILDLEVTYPDHERGVHRLLSKYTELRRASTSRERTGGQAADFVTLVLKKRLFSSPAAFAETLAVHLGTLASRSEGDGRLLDSAVARLEDDWADDDYYADAVEEALAAAAAAGGNIDPDQRRLLEEMVAWAEEWRNKPDAKAATAARVLRPDLSPARAPGAPPPGTTSGSSSLPSTATPSSTSTNCWPTACPTARSTKRWRSCTAVWPKTTANASRKSSRPTPPAGTCAS